MKQTKMIYVCRSCGYYGPGVITQKGNPYLSGFLFILGIFSLGIILIPWFLYEAWRWTTKGLHCPQCDEHNCLVPAKSSAGQKIIKEYDVNTEVNTKKKVETEDDWDD